MTTLSGNINTRPIFMVTHPRSCSTAFERVFMTRRDVLECAHEPFGDAFYYGPERLSERYEIDEAARIKSGLADVTYKNVLDRLQRSVPEGKRLFIKDMAYYLVPPDGKPAKIAPSLAALGDASRKTNGHSNGLTNGAGANGTAVKGTGSNGTAVNGSAEKGNPTVVPLDVLRQFHFTFLIRHPRRSIPSYYRCTIPPLDAVTGFSEFVPGEAGYAELRRLFDYLRSQDIVGPEKAGEDNPPSSSSNGESAAVKITMIDADDLLDQPEAAIKAFCREVGLDYSPDMLKWENDEHQAYAEKAFKKWDGFHNDALGSTSLRPRSHARKTPTTESEDKEWREKYGEKGQKIVRECVDANVDDYEYLKSFAIKV